MDEGKASSEGMRVGQEYQAVVADSPQLPPIHELVTKEMQVWSPNSGLPDDQVDEFLKVAKDKHGYNMEQALGLLYWHKYDVERALDDLKNFTPLPDEWSMEDKVMFDKSFDSYGKHFSRIKQQLPEKSIGSLVKYYYTWKKNRNKASAMDREAEKRTNGYQYEEGDGLDSDESDFENEKLRNAVTKPSPMLCTNCVNCAGVTAQMHNTPRGKMCLHCYDYWKRTGMNLPDEDKKNSLQTLYRGPQHKLKKKPPKGMMINEAALIEIAQMKNDNHIKPYDGELISLKRQLVTMKENLSKKSDMLKDRVSRFRPPELIQKTNSRWTNEELLVAVQCVRRYGKDFNAMAEVLGNKNIQQCHNFFINYRRKYNLLDILAEYERQHNLPPSDPSKLEAWNESKTGVSSAVLSTNSSINSKTELKTEDSKVQATSVSPVTAAVSPMVSTTTMGPPPLVNNTSTQSPTITVSPLVTTSTPVTVSS